jgi:hypothetical protein
MVIDSEMGDRHATPPSHESPNVAIPRLWINDAQPDISPLYHKTVFNMPYISTEALVGGAILVALALGYQYIPLPSSAASGTSSGSSKKKNKNKKKSGKGSAGVEGQNGNAEPVKQEDEGKPRRVNGSAETSSSKAGDTAANAQTPSAAPTKPKTLAQKLAPQPRKSKVDE